MSPSHTHRNSIRWSGIASVVMCVALLLGATRTAHSALPVAIDQEQTDHASFFGIVSEAPIGQEFTPALAELDVVQLLLAEAADHGDATVFVQIRDSSIGGPILGISQLLQVADGDLGSVYQFDFASTVLLTPGNLYLIEAVQAAGDKALWGFANGSPYAGGAAIVAGTPQPNEADLWFREGPYAIPEPSTLTLAVLGVVGLVFISRRRHKKWLG